MKHSISWLALALSFAVAAPVAADPPGADPTVVVIGMGEQLLVGEVEAQLEQALAERGLRVVDERGLPAVQLALGDRSGPLRPEAVAALAPHADLLVLAVADYLGNRGLMYLRRYDEAFQARLTLTAVPLVGAAPPEAILNVRVEYTAESLEAAAARALQPAIEPLVARIRRP